jgi:REase_DpnII-MboI
VADVTRTVVPQELVGALAGWFDGGSGPSHTKLDAAILSAGLDVPRDAPNKATKLARAFRSATPEQGRRLVEELIHTLRDGGFMDLEHYANQLRRTRGAIALTGGTLTEEGFLHWTQPPATQVRTSPAAVGPATVPPPAEAAPRSPAGLPLPSHERLLSILRRVPEAFRPLVRERRRGHTSLELVDEYDLQDAAETALRLIYDDVRPEERTPSYAGSSTTQDFLLRDVHTMVEIKVTRAGRRNVQVRDEITVDTESYRRHPDVRRMVFAVYDIGSTITNPRGFERDLSRRVDGMRRDVLVVPWPY